MSPTKRVNLIVAGLVQGVGFRMFIDLAAQELKLCGWVRNRPDGTVEIEAQGPEEMIDKLLKIAQKGPSRSRVTSLRKEEKPPDTALERFTVRYR
ncbi:MAG: acylphosphatase [Chlorobium sp.]|nr:MAG: acylphosphatase [Chlorobium sp.]